MRTQTITHLAQLAENRKTILVQIEHKETKCRYVVKGFVKVKCEAGYKMMVSYSNTSTHEYFAMSPHQFEAYKEVNY